MQSIQILLSTYQGAAYLEAQLDSLVGQDYPSFAIQVRDDGSSDATHAILAAYASRYPLYWQAGENLGVRRSFDTLLRTAPDADYYAYCDQDDVWSPEKLRRAADQLSTVPDDVPALYFTLTSLVDENLTPLQHTFPIIRRPVGFGNALAQNIVIGCTSVMNHAARQLLNRVAPDWSQIRMHDWWAYLVIASHGEVLFEPFASVQYRQHGNNQVGTGNLTLRRRLARTWKNERIITRQAAELRRCYADSMHASHLHLLDAFLAKDRSILKRFQLATRRDLYRQRPVDDLLMRLLILSNRI